MNRRDHNKEQADKAIGLFLKWAWEKVSKKIFKKKKRKK